jgi:dolichol-phosphate mannosyltransferase
MEISIVSPIYKGEKMLDELVSRVEASVSRVTSDYEIILVNDCSPDNSWVKMKEICESHPKVKGVNLSRNFGQHKAITAGLSKSTGEWVIVMDCDLQDVPEEIPNLYVKAQEGYDVVQAQRVVRQDKYLKKLSSTLFHKTFDYLTETKTDKTVANYGIYRRKVVEAVLTMGDSIRSFQSMVRWVGFNVAKLPVEHGKRLEGNSGYNFMKLMRLAIDMMVAFSDKPLKLIIEFGFVVVAFSIFLSCYYLAKYFIVGMAVSGFTTLVISLWMIAGIIITILGVIGLYISRIFENTKHRPIFIISEELNFNAVKE